MPELCSDNPNNPLLLLTAQREHRTANEEQQAGGRLRHAARTATTATAAASGHRAPVAGTVGGSISELSPCVTTHWINTLSTRPIYEDVITLVGSNVLSVVLNENQRIGLPSGGTGDLVVGNRGQFAERVVGILTTLSGKRRRTRIEGDFFERSFSDFEYRFYGHG